MVASAYEPALATTMSPGAFLRIRAVRLYPMIIMGTAFGAAAATAQHAPLRRVTELAIFSTLALPFPSWALFPLNAPLWSAFYELLSNLVYVLVRPLLKPRVLATVAAAAAAAGAMIVVALRCGDLSAGPHLPQAWAGPSLTISYR